ncbi:MAG: hypothetical protein BA861_04380 [Desulfobacterales bacterium S3730MH5]|nr:MAG: hypothetical protein BA861_04380 [Desulfobacterales bacterium S3730MH5]OEU84366.1 MAG: hypothetical protein BA865_11145 [Desulfobacterales bacterium S5133MH4]
MVDADQTQCRPRMSDAGGQITSLVERARDGDRTAFEQLVSLFQDSIFRMVYYRTRSRMDAEDLTQEVFIKAFENLSNLRDLERFRTWLFRMAVNRVRDFHRKKRVLAFLGTTKDDNEPDAVDMKIQDDPGALDHIMRHEFWKQIKLLSNRLSRWEREVFFLRFMDHLNIREIAQVLGKSESTVKTHLYRGLKKFREETTLLQLLEG